MAMQDQTKAQGIDPAWAHCTRRQWAHGLAGVCASVALVGSGGAAVAAVAKERKRTLLVLGDSLSAEYGLVRGTGWVALLEQRLAQEAIPATLVNASISGETTSGGLSRLPALLQQHRPTHVVIELGANDALRGFPLNTTRDNLTAMVKAARQSGARVLLVGMRVPPNYGKRYTEDFAAVFEQVARAQGTPLVPFLLKDVADRADARAWFQPDGIHPLAKAHPVMLNHVWQTLKPML